MILIGMIDLSGEGHILPILFLLVEKGSKHVTRATSTFRRRSSFMVHELQIALLPEQTENMATPVNIAILGKPMILRPFCEALSKHFSQFVLTCVDRRLYRDS